ncbi:MAG TPA: NAD-dependent epimerase/dehydratase family protein, partial [Gammaproteobacteria bacterium]|nr:NAD-dependent epimerase/dehydratase family protein [Gammaproteobacteria bacterium]
DIADPELASYLQNVDAVIHLAFVVIAAPAGYDQPGLNVLAARNLVKGIPANPVPLLIHLSSAAVYGPWPDTPVPVTEQAVLRPLPGFLYAQDKVEVEQILLRAYESMNTGRLVILRSPTILGPHAQPYLKNMLHSPFRLAGQKGQALSQCVHELDVAEAIRRCVMQPVAGIYNLAAEPARSLSEWQRRAGGGRVPLPWWLASPGLALGWRRAGGQGPAAWLQGLGNDLVLDGTALYDALDWQPQRLA